MSKMIVAHTNLDPSYPGYINFTREIDGTVTVYFRGNPVKREGCYVCGNPGDKGNPGRCTPGDDRCNNYCNMAPQKGPMQKAPLDCSHIDEGTGGSLTLSAADFAALIAGAVVYAQGVPVRYAPRGATAEIERLRAALTRIRDRINDMPRSPRNDYDDGEKAGIQWACDIAEEALYQQSEAQK